MDLIGSNCPGDFLEVFVWGGAIIKGIIFLEEVDLGGLIGGNCPGSKSKASKIFVFSWLIAVPNTHQTPNSQEA